MAHIKLCLALVTGLFLQRAAAHFILDYPVSAGFDDDGESSYPCGGFNVTFGANNTDYHVGGEAIALTTFHPQANWLYRATLDQSASGNWTNLLPVISQTALNGFCEPSVAVPASWAGKRGVIQVVGNAVDGLLYQVTHPIPPKLAARECQLRSGNGKRYSFDMQECDGSYGNIWQRPDFGQSAWWSNHKQLHQFNVNGHNRRIDADSLQA
ncbi:MAG: hypothetical protein M1829_005752 [Trizodia sp. TS-e1964]|nr:MAG: hypothetical protein M1829_005752 [Trizodia sp. TS-e1964]